MTDNEIVKKIARDICKGNNICTCTEKDGRCSSIMSIADRLYKQGYRPPKNPKKANFKIEIADTSRFKKQLDGIYFEVSRADFRDFQQIKESFYMVLKFAHELLEELDKFQQDGGKTE